MDLCWFDLNIALKKCEDHFDHRGKHPFSRLGYYVLSELLLEIVESIEFLHKLNIIHRDIKCENVLIVEHRRDGRFVKLADFGLAVKYERESQSHTSRAGTPLYMAPEVSSGRNYNTTADLYSLGLLIQKVLHINVNR